MKGDHGEPHVPRLGLSVYFKEEEVLTLPVVKVENSSAKAADFFNH